MANFYGEYPPASGGGGGTITLTGDVHGSGTSSITTQIFATSINSVTSAPNLVTVGVITSGQWSATKINALHGGTGITGSTILSGDITYAGSSNPTNLSSLNIGTTGQVLTVSAGGFPSWVTPATGGSGFNYLSSNTSTYGGTNSTLSFTGAHCAVVGVGAGGALTSGVSNSLYGYNAGTLLTSDGANSAFGAFALASQAGISAGQNSGFGAGALFSNVSGVNNTAIGATALYNNTANYNTAVGNAALTTNTSGANNTGVGEQALGLNSTGSGLVAVGFCAGYNETGSNSFYINNTNQGSLANDKAYSLLYGTFAGSSATISGQQLTVNGSLTVANLNAIGVVTNSAAGLLSTVAPGTSGHVLTSNGTSWISQAPAGGGITGPGTSVVNNITGWNSTTGAAVLDTGIMLFTGGGTAGTTSFYIGPGTGPTISGATSAIVIGNTGATITGTNVVNIGHSASTGSGNNNLNIMGQIPGTSANSVALGQGAYAADSAVTVGANANNANGTGQQAVNIGYRAGINNGHDFVTNVGAQSSGQGGANCIHLGYLAGDYDTAAAALYIDAFDRTNTAGGKVGSIIYGVMNATASSQTLTFNAAVQLGITSGTPTHTLNTNTAAAASGVGTLTNMPSGVSGNPAGYIQITINGGTHYIPYW